MNNGVKGKTTTDKDGRQFVYDSRKRLVEVKDASGRTILSHRYERRKRVATAQTCESRPRRAGSRRAARSGE